MPTYRVRFRRGTFTHVDIGAPPPLPRIKIYREWTEITEEQHAYLVDAIQRQAIPFSQSDIEIEEVEPA